MKNIAVILISLFMASCASKVPLAVGDWEYKITGTPQGDYAGVLTVSKKDKKTLNAVMKSNGSDLPFNQFQFDPKTKKSTGKFDYQGTPIEFNAKVTETAMEGTVSAENMNFPFTATRKK